MDRHNRSFISKNYDFFNIVKFMGFFCGLFKLNFFGIVIGFAFYFGMVIYILNVLFQTS